MTDLYLHVFLISLSENKTSFEKKLCDCCVHEID